jgi:glutathione S-transferase
MEGIRPVEKQEAGNILLHTEVINRALIYAATELGHQEWCEGSSITLADLALASALVYLDLRMPALGWRTQHPTLSSWFERMHVRPSMLASLAE